MDRTNRFCRAAVPFTLEGPADQEVRDLVSANGKNAGTAERQPAWFDMKTLRAPSIEAACRFGRWPAPAVNAVARAPAERRYIFFQSPDCSKAKAAL